jgi:trehalose 6-phosphate phosphatase
MVMEIRPPIGIDKGYAVKRLVKKRRLDSVIMLGDDTTDVDAFRTIRRLRGVRGAGILVLHDDTAQALMETADYSLVGVGEVEMFLEWLVAASDGSRHE